MIKVKLEANEVELALNVAAKRYIGNLRMGKGFSYGYTKGIKSQLTDGILGALSEVAYAKATNSFYNGSYSDDKQFYSDSDFQNNIEIIELLNYLKTIRVKLYCARYGYPTRSI